jgi:serine/threonine-protein kinase
MCCRDVGYRLAVRETVEGLVAGRYRFGDVLGRGGMGEVYRATDEVLDRDVAIKLMLPVPQTMAGAERFLREARAMARISSPHVVAAYDFGEHAGGYYLALELVSGSTLAHELECNGLLTAERAKDVIRQAATGLAAVHRQGIVHRDIKPDNLLLADDGTVKIADFGIVRTVHEAATTLTSAGQIVGTSHYLAPERALGKPAEPASDVYALGCVLYHLVTGRPPFVAETPASIMYQHVHSEPAAPSDLRPDLAGDLEGLIFWMLEKDPVRRPTAHQVADGVPPPTTAEPALDADRTRSLAVRRVSPRQLLAGAAAAVALTASATAGIFLETKGLELPATAELSPQQSGSTLPAVIPAKVSTPRPSTPSSSRPTTTAGPTSVPVSASSSGAGRSKAETRADKSSQRGEQNKSGHEGKQGKPGSGKPTAPKH